MSQFVDEKDQLLIQEFGWGGKNAYGVEQA